MAYLYRFFEASFETLRWSVEYRKQSASSASSPRRAGNTSGPLSNEVLEDEAMASTQTADEKGDDRVLESATV